MTAASRELTCRDVTELLGEDLAGALPLRQRALFEEHLAECPDCVRYLRQYETTVRLARDACGAETAEADVPDRLVEAILAARKTERREARRGRVGRRRT